MPSRRRGARAAVVLVLLAALVVVVGVAVTAGRLVSAATQRPPAVPEGWAPPATVPVSEPLPADTLAFDSDRSGTFELYTTGYDGGEAVRLTDDPRYDSWSPRISPDRRTILFHRTPAGVHDLDHAEVSLWAVGSHGGEPVELRPPGLDGWVLQGHAEWSPDGGSLVMFGGSRINPQIHLTDATGQGPRALTDRGGTNLDPYVSPDGTEVAFVGCPQAMCTEQDYEIYVVPVAGGEARRVTDDDLRDHDPVWSPDGSRMAWLTSFGGPGAGVWDVRIGDAEGRDPQRLFGDAGVTSRPEFSPDGRFVFVHRIPPGGTKFDVYRVGLDGSDPVVVTEGQPGNNEYPSP